MKTSRAKRYIHINIKTWKWIHSVNTTPFIVLIRLSHIQLLKSSLMFQILKLPPLVHMVAFIAARADQPNKIYCQVVKELLPHKSWIQVGYGKLLISEARCMLECLAHIHTRWKRPNRNWNICLVKQLMSICSHSSIVFIFQIHTKGYLMLFTPLPNFLV